MRRLFSQCECLAFYAWVGADLSLMAFGINEWALHFWVLFGFSGSDDGLRNQHASFLAETCCGHWLAASTGTTSGMAELLGLEAGVKGLPVHAGVKGLPVAWLASFSGSMCGHCDFGLLLDFMGRMMD